MKTHNANAIKPQNQAKSGADMGEMPELVSELGEELTAEEMMMIVGGDGVRVQADLAAALRDAMNY
ncbi:MAG: hypothetical protein KME46_31865 [Brasilonema angustatum HA4187-MV1]|jgi:hypothetical protein|nr:hypothetical protein [Brasilonema angustatum HA4187-MV1]